MTSYVDYKIDDLVLKSLQKECMQWSRGHRPLLALSVYSNDSGGTINLLNEDGLPVVDEKDDNHIPNKFGVKVSYFEWHPISLSLAISWESGEMGIYCLKNSKTQWIDSKLKNSNRQKSIIKMEWINEGQALITGRVNVYLKKSF
jgi:hypothetical protein